MNAPFPAAIEWYIWDIRGPATDVNTDFKSTPIGIDYIVGHLYGFTLKPSGTNTITFNITDKTSGVSWSKSDWHWTILSTAMLADESMFSPASCVEGYTTSAVLSGTPLFVTTVGKDIIVNRYYGTGQGIPSGIATNRICVGAGLWRWEMYSGVVGGIVISIDKFGLLAPYIGFASTIIAATAATAIYVKRVKHKKEE
jgi:hypothetical protein